MNKSIFMGRLIRDPEIRYSQTDNGEMAVAIFRIAVDRKFVRRDGVKADFITCSAFGRLAEFVEQYLLQGLKVIVTGRMENDNYTNRNGEKVYGMRLMAEDIEFAESKKAMEERMQAEQDAQNGRNSAGRSKRPGSASRDQSGTNSRPARSGDRREPAYEEDYEREQEERTASARGANARAGANSRTGNGRRNAGGRAAASRNSSRQSRDIDEEYMDMNEVDEELDFD